MDKKPTVTRAIAPNQPPEEPQTPDYETAQYSNENTRINRDTEVGQQGRGNSEEQAVVTPKADPSDPEDSSDAQVLYYKGNN